MAIEALHRIPNMLQGGQAVRQVADFLINTHAQPGMDPAILGAVCLGGAIVSVSLISIGLLMRHSGNDRYGEIRRNGASSHEHDWMQHL